MDLILKIFKRTSILTWSWQFYDIMIGRHYRPLKENNSNKDLKLRLKTVVSLKK